MVDEITRASSRTGTDAVPVNVPWSLGYILFFDTFAVALIAGVLGYLLAALAQLEGAMLWLIGSAGIMVGLWNYHCWLRIPALLGRRWAIRLAYYIFLPQALIGLIGCLVGITSIGLLMYGVVSGRARLDVWEAAGKLLGMCTALLIYYFIFVDPLMDRRRLLKYSELDGFCPVCRTWRFGRAKADKTVTCESCHAVLKFVSE